MKDIFFDRYGLLKDRFVFLIIVATIFVLTFGGCSLIRAVDHSACKTLARGLHTKYKYGFIAGCRFEYRGVYVPSDNYMEVK